MQGAHKFQIGNSGWHYDHRKGAFYPQEIRSDEFLAFYTQHFSTIEINNSFYQLPDANTLNKGFAPQNACELKDRVTG